MNIGSDFIDEADIRQTTIQLVDRVRGSIAIAWFENNRLTRCEHISSVDKTRFLDDAKFLLKNSIPVRFAKQTEFKMGAI
jgi:CRISPR/Cas system CMR-associated protein Cmr3 (group 5 of RAMP superfamily)